MELGFANIPACARLALMMRVMNWALPGLAAVLILLVIRRWFADGTLDIASLVIAIAAIALMILTRIQDKSL